MLRLGAELEDNLKRKKSLNESSDEDEEEELTLNKKSLLRKSNEEGEEDMIEDEDDDDDGDLEAYKNDSDKTEQEKDLENLVFGSIESSILSNINKFNKTEKKKFDNKKAQIADSFETRKPKWSDDADQEIVDLNQFDNFSNLVNKKNSQIKTIEIEESLKSRYTKYYGTPMWADLDLKKKKKKKANSETDEEEDEDEEGEEGKLEEEEEENLFQHTGTFLNKKKGSILAKGTIDIKSCTDANKEEPQQARLQSIEFHPSARVMLTAGLGQKLSLFQIDGKKNPKIQTMFVEKFPILSAHFTKQNGEEIIMGSRHKNFYYYDMMAGKMVTVRPPVKAIDEFQKRSISSIFEVSPDNRLIAFVGSQGQIHLFTVKSKEWIDTLKINGNCSSICFSNDSKYLFAFGDDKDVNIFDMNHRGYKCLHKFSDYGCLSGTSISVSNNSQFLATGCKSGVVNLYDLNNSILNNLKEKNPKPLKSFMNLTTPCTSLKFNSTSEILAISSSHTENACKLIHTASMSVFSNFPLPKQLESSSSTRIRIPMCVDFSLNSGYFSIGNHKGNALLYRLKHYGTY